MTVWHRSRPRFGRTPAGPGRLPARGRRPLAAAAQASAPAPQAATDRAALPAYITALPAQEENTLLLDAALGVTPQPGPVLLARYHADRPPGPRTANGRRSTTQLLDAAHLHRVERTRREAEEKAAATRARAMERSGTRDAHRARLAKDTEQAWRDVDKLIAEKKPGPYCTAVTLLTDLRDVHSRAGTTAAFERRVGTPRQTLPDAPPRSAQCGVITASADPGLRQMPRHGHHERISAHRTTRARRRRRGEGPALRGPRDHDQLPTRR